MPKLNEDTVETVEIKEKAAKPKAKRKTTKKKATVRRTKKLVIVESPGKVKNIKKYLGKGYEVVASVGHIRDLPKSKLGIDIDNDFEPQYINIRSQSKTIKALKEEAKRAKEIYLATDPDREGEAISWHLAKLLDIPKEEQKRIMFNEITQKGVESGMENPREIDMDLVDAQQARRVLDRIVGYKISPFLWKKIRSGLSAGRVQSAVLKMIVDREQEIKNFVSKEYWSINAKLFGEEKDKVFSSEFFGKNGKKIDLDEKVQVDEILAEIKGQDFVVANIKRGTRQKRPAPPFITSTLQQEASRKLGFQSRRTMKAAQELYEGVDVDGIGSMGLITYMRTDSLRISDEAKSAAKNYIMDKYGADYYPKEARVYKTKSNAQDGHEAIRPSSPELTPAMIKSSLTVDQFKLYRLIWERFIASQMTNCVLDTVQAGINVLDYNFKSSGYSVRFDGFTVLYEEGKDEESKAGEKLPKLEEGDKLGVISVEGNQHFTLPPPRYTEATLIKAMEETAIGRPSTYVATISTITARNYVERDGKKLIPTYLGEVVTNLIKEYFQNIVDVDFTANMEAELDKIEAGDEFWKEAIRNFYGDFRNSLEHAENTMDGEKIIIPDEVTDEVCELCGRNMVVKMGRFGKFLACPGFPECSNTKKIARDTGGICPICGGKILEQKSKKGKKFFGCNKYPDCTFVSWDEPTKDMCPKCGKTLLKKAGKNGKVYCSDEKCDYERTPENV